MPLSTGAGKLSEALLQAKDVVKHYPVRGGIFSSHRGAVRAVQGVSFDLKKDATLGLVGESGCGKSTLARLIIRLEEPTSGEVFFEGRNVAALSGTEFFRFRRSVQMVFQDPYSSLNPRMTVGEIVRDPLIVHRIGKRAEQVEKVREMLVRVGLPADADMRYPHEFSGGQRQRIGVARALVLKPDVIIADEPVSSLDVSVQAQMLNLLVSLQRDMHLTYLFITHDLSVVEYISDEIIVMYLGRVMESGATVEIFARPAHPYTRALMEARPQPDPERRSEKMVLQGETPSPMNPPSGCPFHPRCPYMIPACTKAVPPLEPVDSDASPSHLAACIRKREIR